MIDQKQIIEVMAETLGLPVGDIDMDSSLQDDLGLNPVEIADLLHTFSDKFQIIFEPSEIEHIKSVGNLIELIEDKSLE